MILDSINQICKDDTLTLPQLEEQAKREIGRAIMESISIHASEDDDFFYIKTSMLVLKEDLMNEVLDIIETLCLNSNVEISDIGVRLKTILKDDTWFKDQSTD